MMDELTERFMEAGNDMLPDLPDTPLILPADLNFGDDD